MARGVFPVSGLDTAVTAFEAKTRFGELLDRVSRGEEVVITRHDKAVARLVPEGAPRRDEVRRAVPGAARASGSHSPEVQGEAVGP